MQDVCDRPAMSAISLLAALRDRTDANEHLRFGAAARETTHELAAGV
jgi:hypothetical protein